VTTPARPLTTDASAAPPARPMALVQDWFDSAVADSVREPGALALATTDAGGRISSRVVQVIGIRATGLVFATHSDSRKGRELAETGQASGVLYWREAGRQVCVNGTARPLPDEESEAIWTARNPATHPMSVASRQSAPLLDEDALRERARDLGRDGTALPRPDNWLGYLLTPVSVEFWQLDPEDRLHRRLRYEHDASGWRVGRIQP
jgi:dihydrophenazinedicarboxylate synthase